MTMWQDNVVLEEFEDIKGVIRIQKSKDRQRQNDEMINNDLQNTTQKTKDKATRIPRKKGNELRCSGREAVYYVDLPSTSTVT
jgi:hypothetical protein